jgi:hypothetical protein
MGSYISAGHVHNHNTLATHDCFFRIRQGLEKGYEGEGESVEMSGAGSIEKDSKGPMLALLA